MSFRRVVIVIVGMVVLVSTVDMMRTTENRAVLVAMGVVVREKEIVRRNGEVAERRVGGIRGVRRRDSRGRRG